MLEATLTGMWLMQAAPQLPAALPFTPSVQEWSLGGAFKLKQEKFLLWQAVPDPVRGWAVEPRPTWLLELAPTHRNLRDLSLALESAPASANGGVGTLRARLQYRVAGTHTRVGVELPIMMLVNTASRVGLRALRPMAIFSGRF